MADLMLRELNTEKKVIIEGMLNNEGKVKATEIKNTED